MSNVQHTPGPWGFLPRTNYRGAPGVQRGREGGFLVNGTSRAQEDADARLIAAAPDLLAALECARDIADQEGYDTSTYDAAIAKAKGQA